MNGGPLTLEHGAPLRLVIPHKYGIKNIKRIGLIAYSPVKARDYWGERGYDWYAGLWGSVTPDLNFDVYYLLGSGNNIQFKGQSGMVGARFSLDRLRAAGGGITAETPWQKAAVAAVVDDLFNYQSVLASRVIAEANGGQPVDAWLSKRTRVVERIDQTMNDLKSAPSVDLAMLTVASRQLRALVES